MAGFDQSKLEFSRRHLEEQIQAIYNTLPYIVQVYVTDASTGNPQAVDLFADYIKGIDGHAFDMTGKEYSVSFKSRLPSELPQDLRFEAIKLTDRASQCNDMTGFKYKGQRYAFDGFCDINVQWINGRNYVFLGSELQALALQFRSSDNALVTAVQKKYSKDREGNTFFSGRYYVFVDAVRLCNFIRWFSEQRASYQEPGNNENEL